MGSRWITDIISLIVTGLILLVIASAGGCASVPEITPDRLPEVVAKGITVVEFGKDLCPPCDTQADILAQLAQENPDICFVKVKAFNALIQPTDSAMVREYNIQWTPTTVLLVDGHEVYRWVTLHGRDAFDPVLEAVKSGKMVCTPEGCKVSP